MHPVSSALKLFRIRADGAAIIPFPTPEWNFAVLGDCFFAHSAHIVHWRWDISWHGSGLKSGGTMFDVNCQSDAARAPRNCRPYLFMMVLALAAFLPGCKEYVNPHVPVEADADLLVARSPAFASLPSAGPSSATAPAPAASAAKTVIVINNAPSSDQPLEQELIQREVDLFEQRNPGIRVEFKPWSFTPESFFERARDHTLTDVVEVSASQIPPIVDMNYAADITDNADAAPEMRQLRPEVMKLLTRNGRIYGVPVELHTLALFYNRRLFERVASPPVPKQTPKASREKPKGKGAESLPREFLEEERPSFQVAQYARPPRGYGYPNQEEEAPPGYTRRGEQEVQDYYQSPYQPQQQRRPARRSGSFYDYPEYRQSYPTRPGAEPDSGQGRSGRQPGARQQSGDRSEQGDARDSQADEREDGNRKPGGLTSDTSDEAPAPKAKRGKKSEGTIDQDILTTAEESASGAALDDSITTSIQTAGLPQDWQQLIHTAVKLTDHEQGVYGLAPVLFAREGGREFVQWAVQSGLQIEVPTAQSATLDVNTSAAGEVAQFVKDLHWRYDVTPPTDKCYADNLLKMFSEGKIAMMVLPANRETIRRLLKLGMFPDDIGVAPLPMGPDNRAHLTFGRCLIINSQLDRDRRAAAFKWLMFQIDPHVIALREQYYFREQEVTGIPSVPLFREAWEAELGDALKLYRTFPIFLDYEKIIADHLRLEPPYFTDKLYEAIAQGLRPIVEQENSKPMEAIAAVATEFEAKYLRSAPTPQGMRKYLDLLTRK